MKASEVLLAHEKQDYDKTYVTCYSTALHVDGKLPCHRDTVVEPYSVFFYDSLTKRQLSPCVKLSGCSVEWAQHVLL
jgi:hypothetical protein